MPLVEIDLLEGRSEAELDAISDAVHEAMVAELDVPQRDRFQIITERTPGCLRFDPNYLDIDRDEEFLLDPDHALRGPDNRGQAGVLPPPCRAAGRAHRDANREPRGGHGRERTRGLVLRPRAGELPRASARRLAMRSGESRWRWWPIPRSPRRCPALRGVEHECNHGERCEWPAHRLGGARHPAPSAARRSLGRMRITEGSSTRVAPLRLEPVMYYGAVLTPLPMFCVRLCSGLTSGGHVPRQHRRFWGGRAQSIIRGLRGTRGACRMVGIGRAWCRAGRSVRSLVL